MQSARFFQCARCHCQVYICRACDRGHIYCRPCAPLARFASLRRASEKYRSSQKGRLANANRQSRFRAAKNQYSPKNQKVEEKVTHQGSPSVVQNDQLSTPQPNITGQKTTHLKHCHFCGQVVSDFLRKDFLRDRSHRSRCTAVSKRQPYRGSG